MAKTASRVVVPIIFLVMFALVEQNMGRTASLGRCEKGQSCTTNCKVPFGEHALGFCDRSTGGLGSCICVYPKPPPKTTASLGPCEKGKSCNAECKVPFGEHASGFCDRTTGGLGICVCVFPRRSPKTNL